MGKNVDQRRPTAEQPSRGDGTFICRRCSWGFARIFSFKCIIVSLFSFASFLPAIFWVFHGRYGEDGFDASIAIKLSATVQSSFRLQKPVSDLIPYISRLEYDINDEIGVPSLKVAVLSMHEVDSCNTTKVVFGFIPDNITSMKMNPVALSLLKSSLVDLFLQRCSLLLTSSIFGESSVFEIMKFPGGVSILLEPTSILSLPIFNFTLTRSISDISRHLQQFKEELQSGLHLMPSEVIYLQTTNNHGSTIESSVVVQASVASDMLAERLKQLAQLITGPTSGGNLGLDHSVFGNVKGISLSSFLSDSLQPPAPAPSPSPSLSLSPAPLMAPARNYHEGPSSQSAEGSFQSGSQSPNTAPSSSFSGATHSSGATWKFRRHLLFSSE